MQKDPKKKDKKLNEDVMYSGIGFGYSSNPNSVVMKLLQLFNSKTK